ALLAAQSKPGERGREAVHPPGELGIGARAAVVDVGDAIAAAGGQVSLEQIVRGVVVARNADARRAYGMIGTRDLGHGSFPPGSWVIIARYARRSIASRRQLARSCGSCDEAASPTTSSSRSRLCASSAPLVLTVASASAYSRSRCLRIARNSDIACS